MIVYLISAELNGNIVFKIGHTKRNINKRIKELKTGNASDFSIINTYESKWATKIESSLHKYYSIKKINGEWFNLDEKDINLFKSVCESINYNLDLLSEKNTYIIDKGGF